HCWQYDSSRACFDEVRFHDDWADVVARLEAIPLSASDIVIDQDVAISAESILDMNLGVRFRQGKWSGTFSGHLGNARLAWSEDEAPLLLDFRVNGQFAESLRAEISSTEASEHRIDVQVDIPDITSPAQLIAQGNLAGEYAPLLVALVPRASQGRGHVDLHARYDGTVQPPTVTGQMGIEDASLVVPAAGIQLAGIQLSAQADRQELLEFSGTATSGDGTVSIDGEIEHPLTADRKIRIALTGAHFLAANRKDLVLTTSPDLIVTQSGGKLTVAGNIGIESGEIRLKQFDTGVRARSADVRVENDEEQDTPLSKSELDLNIRVGDAVHIVAFGLNTHIAGNLSVQQGESTPLRALGTLTLSRGTFERYGQKLNIDRGRLIYSGPINNPIVDVVTSRTITRRSETVRVVLTLSGPANNIQSQITSTPPMSEANALSWLLLGRPLKTASASEGKELSSAALSF
ncbi:MAG: translocation/assembly module TamB domain-containing protein, partial [Pseudomonadales bacterium]|nr:translocation/assembly module TamB domain-containing protein [Pseudomonadales bacterium]